MSPPKPDATGAVSATGRNGIVIEDARPLHIPAVVELATASPLLQRYGHDPSVTRRDWEPINDGTGRLVATFGGAVVGMLRFVPRAGFARSGYLKLILVGGGQQGRGVGAALMAEMERRWLKPAGIFLLCTADNEAAIRFYAKRGYAEVGLVPGFVRPGLDERILFKAAPATT